MDSLLIALILSSNVMVDDFTTNLNVDQLFQYIEDEEVIGYGESQMLNLNNSPLLVGGQLVTGKLVLSSSKDKTGHLVFFKTHDELLWEAIRENVISKSRFTQRMIKNGYLNAEGSMFYGMPELNFKGKNCKISVVVVEGLDHRDNEVQIFMKLWSNE